MSAGFDVSAPIQHLLHINRMRERIRLGHPAEDALLKRFWFPNVRRVYDPTTIWIQECVVTPLRGTARLARSLAFCRLINRISVLSTVLPVLLDPMPFDRFARLLGRVLKNQPRICSSVYKVHLPSRTATHEAVLAVTWSFDDDPSCIESQYLSALVDKIQAKPYMGGASQQPSGEAAYNMALDLIGDTAVDRETWAPVSRSSSRCMKRLLQNPHLPYIEQAPAMGRLITNLKPLLGVTDACDVERALYLDQLYYRLKHSPHRDTVERRYAVLTSGT